MNAKKLKQVLQTHKLWLERNSNGKRANLIYANLKGANLKNANLTDAYLEGANLEGAYLEGANLQGAYLEGANLKNANLTDANLINAYLRNANLTSVKGLKKVIGVKLGNIYWKRFNAGLCNEGYQYKLGLNKLRPKEKFAADERVMCSFPGFHFASREWCAKNYPNRPLEAKIRIPLEAKINEPWATDGKASADMIEILEVFDVKTRKNISNQFK